MSTTRTEQRTRRPRAGRLAAAAAGLLVGAGLIAASAPILAGAAAAAPGDGAARELRHRTVLDNDGLLTVIETRSAALGRYPLVEWRRELATASVTPRDGRMEPAAIARGIEQTRAALVQAPASPQDWMRLAVLETMSGDRASAVGHLSTALLTGADMPRLRWNVIFVGLALWGDLPHEERMATLEAMRHAWQGAREGERKALLRSLRDRGVLPLARLALAREDGLQEELDML